MDQGLYNKVFLWEELPQEVVREGVRRCAFATDDYMMVMNVIEAEMTPNPHTHETFDQLVYIVSGRAHYHVSGVAHEMGPGSIMMVPAGAEHYLTPIDGPVHNLDIFSPPRADYQHLLDYAAQFTQTPA